MSIFDEAADSNGRTKMFHIIVCIIPRMVARCGIGPRPKRGNLCKFLTAKLEACGRDASTLSSGTRVLGAARRQERAEREQQRRAGLLRSPAAACSR
eukprot:6189694-Pleurochrysis_carterae.AAC.2